MSEQSENKSILDFLNEGNWIKGSLCLDENDMSVNYDSKYACKWCIMGAIFKSYSLDQGDHIANQFYSNNGVALPVWNDMPTITFEQIKLLAHRLNI